MTHEKRRPKLDSPFLAGLADLGAGLGSGASAIALAVAKEIAEALSEGLDDDAVADRVAGRVRAMKTELDRLRASKEKLVAFVRGSR